MKISRLEIMLGLVLVADFVMTTLNLRPTPTLVTLAAMIVPFCAICWAGAKSSRFDRWLTNRLPIHVALFSFRSN